VDTKRGDNKQDTLLVFVRQSLSLVLVMVTNKLVYAETNIYRTQSVHLLINNILARRIQESIEIDIIDHMTVKKEAENKQGGKRCIQKQD
jgi:hypothetical protein